MPVDLRLRASTCRRGPGISKQAAWEAHGRWIDDQAEQHRRSGYQGLDEQQEAAARDLAGQVDEEA